MSFIFWGLLILAIAFTGSFIYAITASVRAYRRGEFTDNQPIRFRGGDQYDFDLDLFAARWTCIFWILTLVWGLIEGAFRLLS